MNVTFSVATRKDLPPIQKLLNRCSLPADDVAEHLDHFQVARRDGMVIGTVGLEIYGSGHCYDLLLSTSPIGPRGWVKRCMPKRSVTPSKREYGRFRCCRRPPSPFSQNGVSRRWRKTASQSTYNGPGNIVCFVPPLRCACRNN